MNDEEIRRKISRVNLTLDGGILPCQSNPPPGQCNCTQKTGRLFRPTESYQDKGIREPCQFHLQVYLDSDWEEILDYEWGYEDPRG